MKKNLKKILVTGAHRSGSTFVGTMLSLPISVGYIYEPFNRDFGMLDVEEWFPYVTNGSSNVDKYRRMMNNLFDGTALFKKSRGGSLASRAAAARIVIGSRSQFNYRATSFHPLLSSIVVKDPIACLSAEWLHKNWDMDVLVLMRHPAAFVASVLRMGWRFDVGPIVARGDLMNDHLGPILDHDRSYAGISAIEEATLMWNCLYRVMTNYVDRNPAMVLRTHEEISRDPLVQFEALYRRFDLPFSRRVARIIGEKTGESNPTAPKATALHTMNRDSRSNIKRWKTVLSQEQIHFIRSQTEGLSSRFYSESDW